MSTVLDTPTPQAAAPPPVPAPSPAPPAPARNGLLLLGVASTLATACLPLARVFVGLGFVRPVAAALLLSLLLAWGCRRLDTGPLTAAAVSAAGWVLFAGLAFVPTTLAAAAVPTPATLTGLAALWQQGLTLIRALPAPVFPEPALLLITCTGVWALAHTVEGLVFRLRAPGRALLMALVLWAVPLSLAPDPASAWAWAAPFLATAGLLLLLSAHTDIVGAATEVPGRSTLATGAALAALAIAAGGLLAGTLPGYGEPAWLDTAGSGHGTTVTTNPIVDIRSRLVSSDTTPVLRVQAPRPLYLRTTSLDVYGADERWTNSGIRASRVRGSIPFEVPIAASQDVPFAVGVLALDEAVLVPAPYQVRRVDGPLAPSLQYDQRLSTFTVEPGRTLSARDGYEGVAAVPVPPAHGLGAVTFEDLASVPASLTALPENGVPPAVVEFAREIVTQAGASTPFTQAMALQDELRTWTYSLDPPPGHGMAAMTAFVTSRTGYCEQFAGTMAVMLRALGIPSRVAVGFTPGTATTTDGEPAGQPDGGAVEPRPAPEPTTTYTVSYANAHAWVEVLFPRFGWIAFEPTPRSDGNVLVPTPRQLAPAQTVAEQQEAQELSQPTPEDREFLPTPAPRATPEARQTRAGGGGSGERRERGAPLLPWLLAPAAVGLVAVARGRRSPRRLAPAARVLDAEARVLHVGRGLGVRRRPSETEREHLQRLAGHSEAAAVLAASAAAARYAPEVDGDEAVRAEQAAEALCAALLAELSAPRRLLVRTRGRLSALTPPGRAGRRGSG